MCTGELDWSAVPLLVPYHCWRRHKRLLRCWLEIQVGRLCVRIYGFYSYGVVWAVQRWIVLNRHHVSRINHRNVVKRNLATRRCCQDSVCWRRRQAVAQKMRLVGNWADHTRGWCDGLEMWHRPSLGAVNRLVRLIWLVIPACKEDDTRGKEDECRDPAKVKSFTKFPALGIE